MERPRFRAGLALIAVIGGLASSGCGGAGAPLAMPPPPMTGADEEAPRFPWPPPKSSSAVDLGRAALGKDAALMGDAAQHIALALRSAGYEELGYFAVPDGFAIVTRLETIRDDGGPAYGDQRWALERVRLRWSDFSLKAYLDALLAAPPGRFRTLAFVATDLAMEPPFPPAPTRSETEAWSHAGASRLPRELEERPLTPRHHLNVLLYQFAKAHRDDEPELMDPSLPTLATQLERTAVRL